MALPFIASTPARIWKEDDDRCPNQSPPQVLLHLRDEPAREGLQIEVSGVLRADDEAELPLLPRERLGECLAVEGLAGAIKAPRRSIPLDAIAFEVGEVPRGCEEPSASHRDVVRFHNAATRIRRRLPDVVASSAGTSMRRAVSLWRRSQLRQEGPTTAGAVVAVRVARAPLNLRAKELFELG
jgi:hypothetical protein